MTDDNSIENRLEQLAQAIGSDKSLVDNVMSGVDAGTVVQLSRVKRTLPMKRLMKLAAAAAIIIAFVLLIATFLDSSAPRAYAVGQTVEAFENVRYMHIIQRDRAGNTEDERWIEIDPDGVQARYRQDTPARSFFVVDDRQTVFVHHADKKTAVLYDPNDRTWTWFSAPGKLFQQLAAVGDDYYTVAENVRYKGRPAHHLRWVVGDTDIYIDPETKLPFAHGEYEITYEVPPEDTFDIVIPDDVILVDKRPGAKPAQEPQWMIEEARREELDDVASDYFNDARRALVGGDHVKAVELFTKVVEIQPGRNWAWFWMGRAHYELGEYDLAIWEFSKVIDMFRGAGWDASYCHLARGLAFQAIDMDNMAHRDFGFALPVMIEALGNIKQTAMFDYADDPMFRSMSEDERPSPQQSQWNMIERLREVTGQDFGYDRNDRTEETKKRLIDQWKQWWEKDSKYRRRDLGAAKDGSTDSPKKGTRERARDGVVHIEEGLESLRKALGIEKWIVLGHSYGGVPAQSYCLTYPHSTAGILGGNHPNGRLIIFQESGHSPFDDEPEVFFSTLKDFIGSLPNISAQKLEQWPKGRVKSA